MEDVRVQALPTAEILRPILEHSDETSAGIALQSYLDSVAALNFDLIINL